MLWLKKLRTAAVPDLPGQHCLKGLHDAHCMRLCEAGNNEGTGRRRPQQVGHQSYARQGEPFVMIDTLYGQVAWR